MLNLYLLISIVFLLITTVVSTNELPRIACRRISASSFHDHISEDEQILSTYKSSRRFRGRTTLINLANFYWMGLIEIGTPGKAFLIDFDTGSTDLWVPSIDCLSTCKQKSKYNSKSSNTSQANGANFRIAYGDGSYVIGRFVNDTVTVANLSVLNQAFAQATNTSGFSSTLFDGILGLGYPSVGTVGQTPIFYNMWQQNLIPEPIFSFYFNPNPDVYPGGELIFGGVDRNRYCGSITYVDILIQAYWEFLMNNVTINNRIICSNCRAILDTGTTLIVGPTNQMATLNRLLGGEYNEDINLYTVDCHNRSLSSFPDVNFSIGNETFILTPLQYLLIVNVNNRSVCFTVFQGVNLRDYQGNLIWILGNYFLSRFYSIYNIHSNQIGLAKSISYNYTEQIPRSIFINRSSRIPIFLLIPINSLFLYIRR